MKYLLSLFLLACVTTKPSNRPVVHYHLMGILDDENLEEFDLFIQKERLKNTPKILVWIDSEGGVASAGINTITLMKQAQDEGMFIQCIVNKAYSLAFAILTQCDAREALSTSKIMWHNGYVLISRPIKLDLIDVEQLHESSKMYSVVLDKLIYSQLSLSWSEYQRFRDTAQFYTAHEFNQVVPKFFFHIKDSK